MKFSTIVSITIILIICGCSTKQGKRSDSLAPARISEDSLLTLTQKQTFKYFWDGAEPNSGMARERYHVDGDYPNNDQNIVTTGGTGFGIMAILVGIERGFISRDEGFSKIQKIANFLGQVDRYHGVWSHWIDGVTGKVKPFSSKDDGGDLVETSFLAQGLLCARQYFINGSPEEIALSNQLDQLWKDINWSHYRGAAQEDVLFWHWSPNHEWEMNFRIRGYNECLITYVLAASSPTYPIASEVYHHGWAMDGKIVQVTDSNALGLKHQGGQEKGGPLFWAHYSFLGLDPRKLKDRYTDYWQLNKEHVRLNRQHCINNPKGYKGYSTECWGLTASYSLDFYAAHSPQNDLGVISPTAAISSIPYAPEKGIATLRHFYEDLGDQIWGKFGFYDAFSIHDNWYPQKYLAIDQGPIIIMIENYRSGLLWNLFMSCEEVQAGLTKLGFEF